MHTKKINPISRRFQESQKLLCMQLFIKKTLDMGFPGYICFKSAKPKQNRTVL